MCSATKGVILIQQKATEFFNQAHNWVDEYCYFIKGKYKVVTGRDRLKKPEEGYQNTNRLEANR